VTNSSSSSFIVTFDKAPESTEEMQKLLFGERKEYPDPYSKEFWPTNDIARIVFEDMNAAATKEEIIEELETFFHWSVSEKYERQAPQYPYDGTEEAMEIWFS
jgi:hypothetical protein